MRITSNTISIPIVISLCALSVSLSAFVVAVLNFRRKAGQLVRGTFSIASSVSCDDPFISGLILENLKDRAITIFEVYVKVGASCYIQVENFGSKPLVLRAYETYHKEYGPIEFYTMNMKRVAVRQAFRPKTKKRLVLATSEGRYVVSSEMRRWTPFSSYFRNHLTLNLAPIRCVYKNKDIGGNVKFVIEFLDEDGHGEIVLLHANDWQLKLFKKFQLSREALETKEALESFLQQQLDAGTLTCKSYVVIDMQEWRKQMRTEYSSGVIDAKVYGTMHYHLLGRLQTWLWNRKLSSPAARPQPSINPEPKP